MKQVLIFLLVTLIFRKLNGVVVKAEPQPLFSARINQETKNQEDQFEEWGKMSGVGEKKEVDIFIEDEYKWKTKVTQKEDSKYIYYIIETPWLMPVYDLDNFKLDMNRDSIVIKGKVSYNN
jgi:hypothetical protein